MIAARLQTKRMPAKRPFKLAICEGGRRSLGRRWSTFWLRAHTAVVYSFLYLPIVIVVIFSFNANRLATIWTGFSTEVVRHRAGQRGRARRQYSNSFLAGAPDGDPVNHCSGRWPRWVCSACPKRLRMGFDGMTYVLDHRPRGRRRPVHAGAVRVQRSWIINDATGTLRLQLGDPDDHRGAHAVQHQHRAAPGPGAAVGHGPDPWSRPPSTCTPRPGRRSARSRSRSCCRRSSPGFLLAFTFSFDDYVITSFVSGPGSSTLPIFIFGQVQARRVARDQRRRHDDAGRDPGDARHRAAGALLGRAPQRRGGTGGMARMIAET